MWNSRAFGNQGCSQQRLSIQSQHRCVMSKSARQQSRALPMHGICFMELPFLKAPSSTTTASQSTLNGWAAFCNMSQHLQFALVSQRVKTHAIFLVITWFLMAILATNLYFLLVPFRASGFPVPINLHIITFFLSSLLILKIVSANYYGRTDITGANWLCAHFCFRCLLSMPTLKIP